MGLVFQDQALDLDLTVLQLLPCAAALHGLPKNHAARAKHNVRNLAGGSARTCKPPCSRLVVFATRFRTALSRAVFAMRRLLVGVFVSTLQVIVFLTMALLYGVDIPVWGIVPLLPELVRSGLMPGALGMVVAASTCQLESPAGMMNFVIFPMFFVSSALNPIWKIRDASPWLAYLCELNPFTHVVELIRFSLTAISTASRCLLLWDVSSPFSQLLRSVLILPIVSPKGIETGVICTVFWREASRRFSRSVAF